MFLTYFETLLHTNPMKSREVPTTPVGFEILCLWDFNETQEFQIQEVLQTKHGIRIKSKSKCLQIQSNPADQTGSKWLPLWQVGRD